MTNAIVSNGDFSYGLTFTDNTHVYGAKYGTNAIHYTSFSGTVGTLLGTPNDTSAAERPMDYTVLNGLPLLATVDTATSRVRVYDASNPLSLVLLNAGTTQTSVYGNTQLAGSVAWGEQFYEDGHWKSYLYAMNCNNGIQAFVFEVPEPGAWALWGLAALGLAAGRHGVYRRR